MRKRFFLDCSVCFATEQFVLFLNIHAHQTKTAPFPSLHRYVPVFI
jgi:hypothetical protein